MLSSGPSEARGRKEKKPVKNMGAQQIGREKIRPTTYPTFLGIRVGCCHGEGNAEIAVDSRHSVLGIASVLAQRPHVSIELRRYLGQPQKWQGGFMSVA